MKKPVSKYIVVFCAFTAFLTAFIFAGQSPNIYLKSASGQQEALMPAPSIGTDGTYGLYPRALPCIGLPKVVVFVISFPDDGSFTVTVPEIEKSFFDNVEQPGVPWFQQDSLRKFYLRSSYGKLDISGDVFPYTAIKNCNEYTNVQELANEVMEHAGAENALNWSEYDVNQDGYIDGVYFVLKNGGIPGYNYHFSSGWPSGTMIRQGKEVARYIYTVQHGSGLIINIVAHETCHMMGLPDVYAGVSVNNGGLWATSIMDKGVITGDLPCIMKCVFGWIEPQRIAKTGSTQVSLASISDNPELVLVHVNADKDSFDWLLVEYVTSSNNNVSLGLWAGPPPLQSGGGLRAWLVKMRPEFFTEKAEFFRPFGDYVAVSPYIFLEAVHMEGVKDYFLYNGDSITPFTTPNTNYPKNIIKESGNAIPDDLTDSGISIENIQIENGEASFIVTISTNNEDGGDENEDETGPFVPPYVHNPNKNPVPFVEILIIGGAVLLTALTSITIITRKRSRG